jgi:hypothetical protein
MKFLNRLERSFSPYAIHNLTLYLVAFQTITFFACLVRPDLMQLLILDHDRLFAGEWWRVFSMILIPPTTDLSYVSAGINVLFAAAALYFFYIMGTMLEQNWGAARYNLYLLIGYLATLLAALIPHALVGNTYLAASILLAFAWLFPDYQVLLFFIVPVKMKWLGALTWIGYIAALADGEWSTRAQVAAGSANFLLFFHDELWQWMKTRRRMARSTMVRAAAADEADVPMHVCTVCGVTEKSNPQMEFRYCPLCKGTPCYCIEHIRNHEHR